LGNNPLCDRIDTLDWIFSTILAVPVIAGKLPMDDPRRFVLSGKSPDGHMSPFLKHPLWYPPGLKKSTAFSASFRF
jgi:hypothetical protein